MEQDVKIGSVGSAQVSESMAEEKASAQIKVGPAKISLEIEVENADLVALLAKKLPGGFAHDVVMLAAKALGVAVPGAPVPPAA